MELLGEYYGLKYGVDFRSLRLPGVLCPFTPPGGGTTDYSVEMLIHAVRRPKEVVAGILGLVRPWEGAVLTHPPAAAAPPRRRTTRFSAPSRASP